MITPFDLILILIIFSFVLFGLWFGLIHAIGGLLGTLVGSVVAAKYYKRFGATNLSQVISFIVLFTLGSRVTGFIFYGMEKLLKIANILPGIKTINRLAGGILGLVEGLVIIGVALVFATKFPFPMLITAVGKSELAQFLIGVGTTILPIFPQVLKQVQEVQNVLP
ncbi:hypothetical protein A3B21_03575 [Candidatus Uhrbacteria bacterium RIFCSPLOWO2_01_FULL_47_24]|uniref:Colicin V production protein n=1 Tax=Candidatus Uhrbacteria bacterium RIFCSPLOWO2_01_FULL_47_24 TaxID=1802401 RepID=A0A1F7USJ8_9BACT|nr:MAG: hypothetical protein A2753_02630 [Candidatus Uhrbacteria bacterium RIFCSPHIGHO2_01_FULL_47_11]OGL68876.1 MAG: hypothetical protein A3D58_02945 [Candidatus Uhrbacteria bacterium RIFCSPHIGHO2_02_FULL_46_47]OGL75273.1 MAG: hypothetical protein A3F52_04375 [Candidatus Uhrbacteria bacterium RIFCSPHIGHO2_12_FULL_47_11]OGL81270.1 MAG: hypothetical protein A3B21_03575 [Candidatus Uhrbacteria bacterium RIFCSPLOWO2_01_FULL_47_24]OGL85157.1 MAG: hypothetical protein A3J03_01790 [Candidatus Uhrbact